jgi:hypothetical protein
MPRLVDTHGKKSHFLRERKKE